MKHSTTMDGAERHFVEILARHCKGLRVATKVPKVAQVAAVYEDYFAACLRAGINPRLPGVEMELADAS